MRRSLFAGMIPLLLLLAAGEVSAHAMLDRAEPARRQQGRRPRRAR